MSAHEIFDVRVQTADFDVAHEYQGIIADAGNPGAVVMFSGLVRDVAPGSGTDGQSSAAAGQSLTLEHYPGMTEKALRAIVEQARARWPLQAVRVVHRVGKLLPHDQIVLVLTASAHREAAFAAAEFIMDYLKTSAPFWKKQRFGEQSEWVASRQSDYQRAARWENKPADE